MEEAAGGCLQWQKRDHELITWEAFKAAVMQRFGPSNRQEEHITEQAQVKFAKDYASCVYQEFESVLMEPVNNEAPTSTSGDPEECKPKVLTKQLSSPGNQQSQANITATLQLQNAYNHLEKQWRETREAPSIKHLLARCVEALNEGKVDEFGSLIKETTKYVYINGDPIQRVGAYMLEGLVARHESSSTNIYRSLRCHQPESKELLSYMSILYDICPYFKFGHMAAKGLCFTCSKKFHE